MSQKKNYQTLSQELDEVLSAMQQPDVHIDAAVRLYERGLKLIALLEAEISRAENKIEKLALAAAKVNLE